MSRDEVRKLLGGYATGTLTDAEQEALFAAALEDQDLFDELVKEQPVRDLLHDPAARAELLAALDGGEKRSWWRWRPLIAGVAMAGIAAVAVVAWRGSQKPAPLIVAELKIETPAPAATIPAPAPQQTAAPKVPPKRRTLAEQRTTPTDAVASSANFQQAFSPPPPPVPAPARAIDQAKAEKAMEVAPAAALPQFRAFSGRQQQGQQGQQAQQGVVGGVPQALEAPLPRVQPMVPQQFAAGAMVSDIRLVDKKDAAAVQCTILRGDVEVPLATPLNTGETVRLRIVPAETGRVSVFEGEKTLVSAEVEKAKPFDTPPLPFAGSGTRELRLLFLRGSTAGQQPVVMPVTITYR